MVVVVVAVDVAVVFRGSGGVTLVVFPIVVALDVFLVLVVVLVFALPVKLQVEKCHQW